MRKTERLDEFYTYMCDMHKNYASDQREGQFAMNFWGWVAQVKKRDPFFPEHKECMELLEEYVKSNYPYNHSNEMLKEMKNGEK